MVWDTGVMVDMAQAMDREDIPTMRKVLVRKVLVQEVLG